jgi:SNF2 family DNA or RNA helicase
LKEHQVTGITFLIHLMENPMFRGGLLADEMGLGKTSTYLYLQLFFFITGDQFKVASD